MIKRKERTKVYIQHKEQVKFSTKYSNKPLKQEQKINNNCILI